MPERRLNPCVWTSSSSGVEMKRPAGINWTRSSGRSLSFQTQRTPTRTTTGTLTPPTMILVMTVGQALVLEVVSPAMTPPRLTGPSTSLICQKPEVSSSMMRMLHMISTSAGLSAEGSIPAMFSATRLLPRPGGSKPGREFAMSLPKTHLPRGRLPPIRQGRLGKQISIALGRDRVSLSICMGDHQSRATITIRQTTGRARRYKCVHLCPLWPAPSLCRFTAETITIP